MPDELQISHTPGFEAFLRNLELYKARKNCKANSQRLNVVQTVICGNTNIAEHGWVLTLPALLE